MEKIIMVSASIPPETSGSAIIAGNLARQFTAEEMVVAGVRPSGRPAVRWRQDWPRLEHVAARLPLGWRGGHWARRAQVPLILSRCLRLARRAGCTVVIAVFPDEWFLLAGYLAAKRCRARLFPYFHNLWVENRSGGRRRMASWLQRRVFEHAEHVFVISDGLRDHLRREHPQVEFSTLVHSFNEPLPDACAPPPSGSPLRITISGSINESCRDAAVRCAQAIRHLGDARLSVLTGTPREHLRRMGVPMDGVDCETVSRDELVPRLEQSDLVILPHGLRGGLAEAEYQTIFPTKTIEYLICRRPMLAHVPEDCGLTRFLRQHDCAEIVCEPQVEAVVAAIKRLRSDEPRRSELVKNAVTVARRFHAPHVAARLREKLRQTADEMQNKS